jgi:hypothetical protein
MGGGWRRGLLGRGGCEAGEIGVIETIEPHI